MVDPTVPNGITREEFFILVTRAVNSGLNPDRFWARVLELQDRVRLYQAWYIESKEVVAQILKDEPLPGERSSEWPYPKVRPIKDNPQA